MRIVMGVAVSHASLPAPFRAIVRARVFSAYVHVCERAATLA